MPSLPVSVVIPAYNAGATLLRALKSVAAQEMPPAEIVVVDDGSVRGDIAGMPLASCAGGIPVHLRRIPHGGPSRARNHGVAAAGQPWIAFLDADDAWEPAKLRAQWRVVDAADTGLVLVSTDWQRFGRHGTTRSAAPRIFGDGARRILWINRFQTSTVLARRSALQQVGGFEPELDGAEDWDLWMRLAARGRWAHLPLPLVRYDDNPDGVSKDLHRLYRAGLVMLDRYRAGAGDARIARHVTERVVLWHHLRFAWALSRQGEAAAGRAALRAAWRPGTRLAAVSVAATALMPFLTIRLLRRIAAQRPEPAARSAEPDARSPSAPS